MTNDLTRKDEFGFKRILHAPKEELTQKDLAGLFDPELLEILQSHGDLETWVEACNEKGIYPTYLTDHMSAEEKE